MGRTNIDIDDTVLEIVMDRYGLRTKTDAVDYSLRYLAGLPMTIEEIRAMRGSMPYFDVPPDSFA